MANKNHLGIRSAFVAVSFLIGCVLVDTVRGQFQAGAIVTDNQDLSCPNTAICGSERCICESDYCCIEECCVCQCDGFQQCQAGCWNIGAGTQEEDRVYGRGRIGINRNYNRY